MYRLNLTKTSRIDLNKYEDVLQEERIDKGKLLAVKSKLDDVDPEDVDDDDQDEDED